MSRTIVKVISILFNTPKTNLPIPTPSSVVIPGAWNFNGVSINDRPKTKPIHTPNVSSMINLSIISRRPDRK